VVRVVDFTLQSRDVWEVFLEVSFQCDAEYEYDAINFYTGSKKTLIRLITLTVTSPNAVPYRYLTLNLTGSVVIVLQPFKIVLLTSQ